MGVIRSGCVMVHRGALPRSGRVRQQPISSLIYKQMSCMSGFTVAGTYPSPCKLETDLTRGLAFPAFAYI